MLCVLGGSSAAGKTAIRRYLGGPGAHLLTSTRFVAHDFDELGVPSDADTGWRQETAERWIQRALVYEHDGRDLLLAANVPLGELLAEPSAPQLEAIALCLIDCDDLDRVARLRARSAPSGFYSDARIWEFVLFAAWQRLHHADPQWMPQVIDTPSWEEMRWERWTEWNAGDPRWTVPTFNTSRESVEQSAAKVATWLNDVAEQRDRGELPLMRNRW